MGHNCYYCSQDNPYWLKETNFQTVWEINVWCGIIDGQIIEPKVYENTLTGQLLYLESVKNEFFDYIESVSSQHFLAVPTATHCQN